MTERRWMPIAEAIRAPMEVVSTDDKLAIAAALIEEEALRRTADLIAGPEHAAEWYVRHGGRFRFSDDTDDAVLMIEIPVRPFVLAPVLCARRGCGQPEPAHTGLAHAFKPPSEDR